MTLKIGLIYKVPKFEKFKVLVNLNNYFLAHQILIHESERRYFLNVEAGFILQLGKRGELIISSPISLTPMYSQDVNYILPTEWVNFRSFVEMTGLNVGYRFRF